MYSIIDIPATRMDQPITNQTKNYFLGGRVALVSFNEDNINHGILRAIRLRRAVN